MARAAELHPEANTAPDTEAAPDGDLAPDGFAALALDPRLLSTIAALGYEEPTPIQREAIPPLLAGRDLLAQAPTGTGKTAAFALPTLQRIALGKAGEGSTAALILVPTRELAMQVAEALHAYGRELGARVLPVYGGQPIGQQLRGLRRGVDIVVATPGRAVDHLKRGSLRFDQVEVVILDEADEMLDMGFAEDLETLLSATPAERQTALFSATIPRPSRASPSATCANRSGSRSTPKAPPGMVPRWSARSPTSSGAPTSWRRSAGSSMSRTRPPRSSSHGRVARSTTWRRRSARAATMPAPSTAASRRRVATG